MTAKVRALKNIYEGTGSNMKLVVPKGMTGEVTDHYEWGPHKYVRVRFTNKHEEEFGDCRHPLISYQRIIEPL